MRPGDLLDPRTRAIVDAANYARRMLIITIVKYAVYAGLVFYTLYFGHYAWTIAIIALVALVTGLQYDFSVIMNETENRIKAASEEIELDGFKKSLDKLKLVSAKNGEEVKDKRH